MNTNTSKDTRWKVSEPHIMKKPNGDYDGEGWHVCRPHPREGTHSALEYVMDGKLVKYFRSEHAANTTAKSLNRQIKY